MRAPGRDIAQFRGTKLDVVNVVGAGAEYGGQQRLEFGDVTQEHLNAFSDLVVIDDRTVVAVVSHLDVDAVSLNVPFIDTEVAYGRDHPAHNGIVLGDGGVEHLVSRLHPEIGSDPVGRDVDGRISSDVDIAGFRKLAISHRNRKHEESDDELHGRFTSVPL
jgi:hypothetical protein